MGDGEDMAQVSVYLDDKEKTIQDVYLKASELGTPITINKHCGFTCWIRWMSGRIFCKHDRQFCSVCGETWLRFTKSSSHKEEKNGEACSQTPSSSAKKAIELYRFVFMKYYSQFYN